MNLHGYPTKEAVIENAFTLWQAGRIAYDGKHWRWSPSRNSRFSGTVADPFDQVLRRADLTPVSLFEKFGSCEFV